MIVGILALVALLLGGGGGLNYHLAQIEDPVKEFVQDSGRQEAILDASDELQDQISDILEAFTEEIDGFAEVNSAFGSAPEDFDRATERVLAMQEKVSTSVLDAREKMHEQMTEEEWTQVFKAVSEEKE